MNIDLSKLMRKASLHTRAGQLSEATRVIRQGLHRFTHRDTDRETPEAWPDSHPTDFHADSHSILEGEYVPVDEPSSPASPANTPADRAEADTGFATPGQESTGLQSTVPESTRPQSTGPESPGREFAGTFVPATFIPGGQALEYRLYLPPASTRTGALLVMLHGCTQDAADFSAGTAMSVAAGRSGYAVLYPSQRARANSKRCWNWFDPLHQKRGVGEPALLDAMTRTMCQEHGFDLSQVYVAGLSAGGAMALVLAEQYPELFAGVGVHSGVATGLATSVPEAFQAMQGNRGATGARAHLPHRPTLVIHGNRDTVVHPSNAGRIVQCCVSRFEAIHGKGSVRHTRRAQSTRGQAGIQHEYRSVDGRLVCDYLELDSLAHAWSGGTSLGSHTSTGGMSASDVLLAFFEQCRQLATAARAV